MRSSFFVRMLAPFLVTSAIAAADVDACGEEGDANGCAALAAAFPAKVFYPTSEVYEWENKNFWSNTELLSPSCVFRPTSASDVATAVTTIQKSDSKFAVRGGGHMGIKGANSIDDGVLMVLTNLTTLELSADKSTLFVGPAFRWGQLYEFLVDYDLTVAGGRLAPVGVPGLLLAGGVNFLGNQHGFAADNVVSYEVVLANGTIVTATKSQNTDLFWALKGGSSNFGIVTKFELTTFPSKKVWAGIYSVAEEHIPEFYAATAKYSANITDPLSHIVPAVIPSATGASVGAVILFYDSDTVSFPECFKPFTDIPSIASTLDFKTLYDFSLETGTAVVDGINDVFVAGTVVGQTYEELLQGIQITNDTFYEALPALYAQIPAANISIIELDWQPIGSLWMDASTADGKPGNALGLDASKIYLCWAEVVEWIGSDFDDIVATWVESTTSAINAATQAAGLFDSFNYMGDAAGFQSIYPGYGAENEARLLSVSREYDPERFFQTGLPGGFKIGL
ncbi:FAD binding domain protein [Phlyctema vagabunda]|uniref:FAD binding domain protein n=1 Tax=Phlyctema vagabunda TaxID=108571 RepID=A0ABR4PIB6_9HELO